jgi:arylsulfatase A-like enzyme
MVGGTAPTYLDGYSLMPLLNPSHPRSISVDASARPDYITMQYHSNMGNTGSFAIRKDDWKYIAFGTNLRAFKDYRPQLFNVKTGP